MENNPIYDYHRYTLNMAKSMMDKAFFIDKINSNVIIDFGCADGSLLKFVCGLVPNTVTLVGYDIDPKMIETARTNLPDGHYFTDWNKIVDKYDCKGRKTSIICSSVLHEIYHYGTPKDIDSFWEKIFSTGLFEYIVIRDMCPSRSINRPSDINDVAKIYKLFLYKQALMDFETIWGSIENNKNLVHFLLKCKYLEPNWDREVKENYLPLYREDLLSMLDLKNYEIIYHEHYVLPYIKEYTKNDFGIELKDSTHLKLILKRK